MFSCDGISDHASWNEVFHYWDTKLSCMWNYCYKQYPMGTIATNSTPWELLLQTVPHGNYCYKQYPMGTIATSSTPWELLLQTVPHENYCYKQYPFQRGPIFCLFNNVYEMMTPFNTEAQFYKISTPMGSICTPFVECQSDTFLVPFLPEGH